MIIGIIPARYASSRFPGKPLAQILKKSLIQRTYENALISEAIDRLYIITDDNRIATHVKSFGGEALLTEECGSGTERIILALKNHAVLSEARIIINIQGDHPCIKKSTIQAVIQELESDSSASMATAASWIPAKEAVSKNIVKCVIDQNNNALYFSRERIPDNSNFYLHHIGIYAYRPEFLKKLDRLKNTPLQKAEDLEQLKVLEHGYKIKVAIVKEIPLGVDSPQDIVTVEKYLSCP